jgi:leucyl-tRNA synthetase
MVILISPFAPHIAEELWSKLGHKTSITFALFPEYEEKFTIENSFEYPVSFNGKLRFKLELGRSLTIPEIEAAVKADENTQKFLAGGSIKKIIIVPGKIINIVC